MHRRHQKGKIVCWIFIVIFYRIIFVFYYSYYDYNFNYYWYYYNYVLLNTNSSISSSSSSSSSNENNKKDYLPHMTFEKKQSALHQIWKRFFFFFFLENFTFLPNQMLQIQYNNTLHKHPLFPSLTFTPLVAFPTFLTSDIYFSLFHLISNIVHNISIHTQNTRPHFVYFTIFFIIYHNISFDFHFSNFKTSTARP